MKVSESHTERSAQAGKQQSQIEFIAMMASLMSIVALSIDALLPAFSVIGEALNNDDPANLQLLISMIFLGMGSGQLVFGPLSDSFGRKSIVYFGFALFIIASIVCVFAPNLEWMIVGRIFQGIGLSAPRTISISIVRDAYKGDYMARIMSFVTVIFILVPVVAPALGKLILDFLGWQAIFYFISGFTLAVSLWFWKRQPETLKPEHRIPFNKMIFVKGAKELYKFKRTLVFTIISGLITGAFMVYLGASQHIFEVQYNMADAFPYIFASLAITIGISTFLNGTLVMRLGMERLALIALISFCLINLSYVFVYWGVPNPELPVLLTFMALIFFSLGFMFGNINAIAMEPIGHIAGIGAAIIGFISTLMAVPIAVFIGKFVTLTALPMFLGFAVCGMVALVLFLLVRKKSVPAV